MASKTELSVLTRYKEGAVVDDEDRQILDDLASTGYLSFGFNFRGHQETAKLTNIGKQLLEMEKIQENPLKRFWRNYLSHLY